MTDDALRLTRPATGMEDLGEPPNLEVLTGGAPEDSTYREHAPEDGAGPDDLAVTRPGIGDLEAAVALVHDGIATRIVLTGFPSWPGLLWNAYHLADDYNVLILPTVVRPGGKVDIVITREPAENV